MVALQLLPACPTREEQARRFVGGGADVSCAYHALAICDGKIEETSAVLVAHVLFPHDVADEAIDALNRLQDRFAQHRVPEPTLPWFSIRRYPCFVQTVQEQRKRPLGVCRALHKREPLLVQTHGQPSFDLLEAANAAIVHEHEAFVREGVAVLFGQVAFGGSADVREEERRGCLGRYPRQVDAVPCWNRGSEDAGLRAEGGRGVVADAKAITVVRTPTVLQCVSRSPASR